MCRFIRSIKAQPTDDGQYATSWLELYILFRVLGFAKPVPDKQHQARARATVAMQLSEFKNTFRGVLQRCAFNDEAKQLAKPCEVIVDRLIGLGIKGKHPALCCAIINTRVVQAKANDFAYQPWP